MWYFAWILGAGLASTVAIEPNREQSKVNDQHKVANKQEEPLIR